MARSIAATKNTFSYGVRSFRGHLEGTGKSLNTIEGYLQDLKTFEVFLVHGLKQKTPNLKNLSERDLDKYAPYLEKEKFRENSRRRKLLTLRKFFTYLSKRKKFKLDFFEHLPAPKKVERIPKIPDLRILVRTYEKWNETTPQQLRNKIIFGLLLETGANLEDVCKLLKTDFELEKKAVHVRMPRPRALILSEELCEKIENYFSVQSKSRFAFPGNGAGGLGGSFISPRAVELIFKTQTDSLTPRKLRQARILAWFQESQTESEIQNRLGLSSDYAFRVYRPLIKFIS